MNAAANTAAGAPLVRLEDVNVSFGRHPVLRNLNLDVPRGQTLAVIGESGCGKTVLLKQIIGLLPPTQGRVYFDDHNLAALNERQLTRLRIRFGFLFQQAALFDSLTVADNVAFALRQHTSKGETEIRQIVLARLAEVGLAENVLSKKPAELSGGMRKRVGLARALALEPEIMLYDEPTTGLDPIRADAINDLIVELRQQADAIRQAELEKTLRRLPDLTSDERARIEAMSHALVKKLLAQPTERLRREAARPQAPEYAALTRTLFGLNSGSNGD